MNNALFALLLALVLFSCQVNDSVTETDSASNKLSTQSEQADPIILNKLDSLKTGDLVLRLSDGFSSDISKGASLRDKSYSHAGLAYRDNKNQVFVFHMIGGVENPNFNLQKDPVKTFVSPQVANAFAIYRYDFSTQERMALDSVLLSFAKTNLSFDMDFDLKTDQKMYCSEFVYKMILYATNRKDYINLSTKNNKVFVGIDDLYLNNHCRLLLKKTYEKAY